MKFSNLNACLFISFLITCGPIQFAVAEESGFYAEFGVGRSSATESVTSLDENATAFQFAVGYQITPWLAVDAGYIDFGEFDGALTDPAGETLPFTASATGMELGLIGRIPLGEKFAATIKAEQLWWDSEINAAGTSIEDSDNSFAYGAGLEFNLSDRFVLTGMWEQFEMGDTDVDLFSLGIRLTFGAASGN